MKRKSFYKLMGVFEEMDTEDLMDFTVRSGMCKNMEIEEEDSDLIEFLREDYGTLEPFFDDKGKMTICSLLLGMLYEGYVAEKRWLLKKIRYVLI